MKVQCYFEGEGTLPDKTMDYHLPPAEAAQNYCDQYADHDQRQHVCVVPLDAEAKALPGWHTDGDDPMYKMFVVIPSTTWTAREVSTFRPVLGSEPAPPMEG